MHPNGSVVWGQIWSPQYSVLPQLPPTHYMVSNAICFSLLCSCSKIKKDRLAIFLFWRWGLSFDLIVTSLITNSLVTIGKHEEKDFKPTNHKLWNSKTNKKIYSKNNF